MGLDSLVRSLAVSGVTLASSFAYHQPVLYSQDQPKTEQEKNDKAKEQEDYGSAWTKEQVEEYRKRLRETEQRQKIEEQERIEQLKSRRVPELEGPVGEQRITYERALKGGELVQKDYIIQELKRWKILYDEKTNPEGPITRDRVFFAHGPMDKVHWPRGFRKIVREEIKFQRASATKDELRKLEKKVLGACSDAGPVFYFGRGPPGIGKKVGEKYGAAIAHIDWLFDENNEALREQAIQLMMAELKTEAYALHYGTLFGTSLKGMDSTSRSNAIELGKLYAQMRMILKNKMLPEEFILRPKISNHFKPPDKWKYAAVVYYQGWPNYLSWYREVTKDERIDRRHGKIKSANALREILDFINVGIAEFGYEHYRDPEEEAKNWGNHGFLLRKIQKTPEDENQPTQSSKE